MAKDIEMVNPVLEKDENGREILLKVKDLAVTFYNGKKEFRAVHDVNFNVYKGETFSLVGESGSGKTTIGRAIIRINPTSAGTVEFMGKKINGKISKEDQRWVIRNMPKACITSIFTRMKQTVRKRSWMHLRLSVFLPNTQQDIRTNSPVGRDRESGLPVQWSWNQSC